MMSFSSNSSTTSAWARGRHPATSTMRPDMARLSMRRSMLRSVLPMTVQVCITTTEAEEASSVVSQPASSARPRVLRLSP